MNDNYEDSIVTRYYIDENGTPYMKAIVEQQQISTDKNIIQLTETPDQRTGVTVIDGNTMVQVESLDDVEKSENYYFVSKDGLMYFHPNLAGRKMKLNYKSIGATLISTNRIFYKDNNNIIKILDELMAKGYEGLKALELFGDSGTILQRLENDVEKLQIKIDEAEKVIEETEQLIQSGGAATTGDIAKVNSQLEQKVNKDEVANGLTAKGNILYANLPTIGNKIGDYYYCSDGIISAGNYVWNGLSWYFGGTGDDGYNSLKNDINDFAIGINAIKMTWEKGNLDKGSLISSATRLRTSNFYTFNPYSVTINCDNGYKFNVVRFETDGTYASETGWLINSSYTFSDSKMDTRKYKIVIADINDGAVSMDYAKRIKVVQAANTVYAKKTELNDIGREIVKLSQNKDIFTTGEGFIDGKYIHYDNVKIESLSVKGSAELITVSDNTLKNSGIDLYNYCTFYTASGDVVSDISACSPFDASDILQNVGSHIESTNGYNQLIMSLDLVSAYSKVLTGTTTSEKITSLKSKISSIIIAFTGWCNSSDNTIAFKQGNGRFGSWIGSDASNIVGSVPTTSNRNIGVEYIDLDGKLWVILHSKVQGNTTLNIDSVELTTLYSSTSSYKKLYGIGSMASDPSKGLSISINNGIVSNTFMINGNSADPEALRTPLYNIEQLYDEIAFYPDKTIKAYKRIGRKIMDNSVVNLLSIIYDDKYEITTVGIPLSAFNGIKQNTKHVNIYAESRTPGVFKYGKNKLYECCYVEGETLYANIKGNHTIDAAKAYFKDSIVLYELNEEIYYNSITSKPFISELQGEKISINSGYLSANTIQAINTTIYTKQNKIKEVKCEMADFYLNDGFKQTSYSKGIDTNISTINVNPLYVKQQFYGSGFALTESSAYQLLLMPKEDREKLFNKMFSPNEDNLNVIRLCMGQSDFRVTSSRYTYDDGVEDYGLINFSIGDKETGTMDYKYIIPLMKEIININPSVKVIACPWHYPSWMFNSDKFVYNTRTANFMVNYILKFIDAYQRNGIDIYAVSVLNEPEFFPHITNENIADLTQNHLGSLLGKHYPDVKIIGFESNYRESAKYDTIKDGYKDYINAIGVHTYNGTVDSSIFLNYLHKNKELEFYVTERRCMMSDSIDSAFNYMCKQIANDTIARGCNMVCLWNMALDEGGKPAAGGNFGRRGVITISSDGNYVYRNLEYYMLVALSKGISVDAKVIASTSLSNKFIYSIAFIDVNGNITINVFNYNSGDEKVCIKLLGENYVVNCKPYGITRLIINS